MTTQDATDLARVVRRAAVAATKAPSVHNTQPWRFTLAADTLEVHADWTRRLRVLDPRGRQMLISCGCALFNARVSMAAAGYVATVERFSDPARPTLVARLTPRKPPVDLVPIGRLHPWIDARHSNRGAFTGEVISDADVAVLVNAVHEEGVVLLPITKAEHRAATVRLTELANGLEEEDPAYRAELKAWTAVDAGRLDGVPGRSTVLDGRANDRLLLLGTRHDTQSAWLSAGEALEHVLLELTRRGFAASPVANVIEVAATNAPLRAELELTIYPQVLLRVGRAPSTGTSRRRRLTDMFKESA
jgi:hypothetical protein